MELEGKNILFVEDDEFIGGIITHNLEKVGATCEWARDGQEALQKLTEQSFDIVLTDLMMGNVSGLEMLKQIRAHADTGISNLPVLVLTNLNNNDEVVVQARELGVSGFFAKSSTPFESLAGVITCVLNGSDNASMC